MDMKESFVNGPLVLDVFDGISFKRFIRLRLYKVVTKYYQIHIQRDTHQLIIITDKTHTRIHTYVYTSRSLTSRLSMSGCKGICNVSL